MRKALIICILAISITLMVNVKAYADEPTPTPTSTPTPTPYQVMQLGNGNVNLASLYYYYSEVLNTNQRGIVQYLTGSYNYMYMRARGFNYNNISNNDDLIERIIEFGTRFWSTGFQNASRYNSTFQKYIEAIVNYAGTQSVDVYTWIDNNTDEFYLPYSVEGLEAWTTFYNDPSSEGIASWGASVSEWVSGLYYNFAFPNIGWYNSSHSSDFNQYVLNNSPVYYTNTFNASGDIWQACYGFGNVPNINSLYILRGNTYQFYRWGNENGLVNDFTYSYLQVLNRNNTLFSQGTSSSTYRNQIKQSSYALSLGELIDYAFQVTPFEINSNYRFWYPGIQHIYLVDNLNTLANKEEVLNIDDLGINSSEATWIQMPNGQILLNPRELSIMELNPNRFFDILVKPDNGDNGNLVPIDPSKDLSQQIVNNTVINNYDIVAPGVIINVPVDWFESEGNYLDYTYNYSLPFFAFVGDAFLALGEIRIFLLAGIILLICGGVIGKFLL